METSFAKETDGRRRRGMAARAAVLARAVEIASVQGLEGLTLGALAHDLGISKGNIGVLFGDKEALQLRTFDRAADLFIAHVVTPSLAHASPLKRLRALSEGWFDYVERRVLPGGCMLFAASSEYRARPGAIQDRVNNYRADWLRRLATTARAAIAAKELQRSTDADQLAFEITAFQSAANAASLLGDGASFRRARRASAARIAAAVAPRANRRHVGFARRSS